MNPSPHQLARPAHSPPAAQAVWIYRLSFLVGMSLLLPWNAVLEGYDFFNLRVKIPAS